MIGIFTCHNSEQANSLLEINASKNDKDFIAAVNWKKAEEYFKEGKAKTYPAEYYRNYVDEKTHIAVSEKLNQVKVLDPKDCPA